jgi:hypothetical protein
MSPRPTRLARLCPFLTRSDRAGLGAVSARPSSGSAVVSFPVVIERMPENAPPTWIFRNTFTTALERSAHLGFEFAPEPRGDARYTRRVPRGERQVLTRRSSKWGHPAVTRPLPGQPVAPLIWPAVNLLGQLIRTEQHPKASTRMLVTGPGQTAACSCARPKPTTSRCCPLTPIGCSWAGSRPPSAPWPAAGRV